MELEFELSVTPSSSELFEAHGVGIVIRWIGQRCRRELTVRAVHVCYGCTSTLDVLVPCVENDKAELAAVANAAQTSEEA